MKRLAGRLAGRGAGLLAATRSTEDITLTETPEPARRAGAAGLHMTADTGSKHGGREQGRGTRKLQRAQTAEQLDLPPEVTDEKQEADRGAGETKERRRSKLQRSQTAREVEIQNGEVEAVVQQQRRVKVTEDARGKENKGEQEDLRERKDRRRRQVQRSQTVSGITYLSVDTVQRNWFNLPTKNKLK